MICLYFAEPSLDPTPVLHFLVYHGGNVARTRTKTGNTLKIKTERELHACFVPEPHFRTLRLFPGDDGGVG